MSATTTFCAATPSRTIATASGLSRLRYPERYIRPRIALTRDRVRSSGMEPELLTLSLVNAILGRMYLSGYLNRMSPDEVEMVREGVAAQKVVVADIERSHAFWPLGLPGWEDSWVCLGLDVADHGAYLTVWRRPGAGEQVVLPLPTLRGAELSVASFVPSRQAGWDWSWDAAAGELTVTVSIEAPSARVLKLEVAR